MSNVAAQDPPRQGAIIGGWLCFLLGVGVMYGSLWAFWFYVPLLLVAFILSVAAMAQRRVLGGVLLLLATLAVPPVEWLVLAAKRTDEFARKHLPPEHLATYEAGHALGEDLGRTIIGEAPRPEQNEPVATPAAPTQAPDAPALPAPAKPETEVEAFDRRLAEALGAQRDGRALVQLTGDTAPMIFEAFGNAPVRREKIAEYMIGFRWGQMDEFARHDFVQHLQSTLANSAEKFRRDDLYGVSARFDLGEYDFARNAFPIRMQAELVEVLEPSPHLVARYKYLDVPRGDIGGDVSLTGVYRIAFSNRNIDAIPVSLEDARALAPALRAGRQADVSFTGKLGPCVEDRGYRLLYLAVSEVTLTLPQSGQSVTSPVLASAEPDLAETAPPAAAPAAAPMEEVAAQSVVNPQAGGFHAAATEPVMTLRPEAVVSDVLEKDLRLMARNFDRAYAGKRVRYTETVVRKNPREQLLVFKGGGFIATAYDVQARLDEQQGPGFNSVNVGARISIEGTLDRLVPPAFGVGSNSIRIRDAQIVPNQGGVPGSTSDVGQRIAEGTCEIVNVPPGDTVNIRSAAGMNSRTVFSLGNGEVVTVHGESVFNGDTEWVPITFGNQSGWVRSKYLKQRNP